MRAPLRSQRGLAAVELALVMPLFLLLMLGTAELGRAFYQYHSLLKATHHGARYISDRALNGAGAVVLDATDVSAARNLIVTGHPAGTGAPLLPGLAASQVSITEAPAGYVTVQVDYPFQPALAVIPTFDRDGGDLAVVGTLTAVAVMAAM